VSNMKKLIMSLDINLYDRTKYVEDCRTWDGFCIALTYYNKMQTLKLIKYFMTERMSAKRMLARAITRFNTLNKLTEGDLK